MKFRIRWASITVLVLGALFILRVPAFPQSSDTSGSSRDSAEQPIDPTSDASSRDVTTTKDAVTDSDIAGGGEIGPDYVIGPEDVLTIEVLELNELQQTVRVENDGTILVKLLGRVKAAGLTTGQLRDELQKSWGKKYLQDPQVSIFIRQFHARPVSVVGAVSKPGLYQLPAKRTLLEVLAMAGGLAQRTDSAAGRTLYITRKNGFGNLPPAKGMTLVSPDRVKIDIPSLMQGQDNALNIPIKPYDIISVDRAGVVYVVGNVKRAGGFTLADKTEISVLQALALAEGLAPNAKKHAAQIIHRTPGGGISQKRIDLGKIMDGKAPDVEMAVNDVLFVPNNKARSAGTEVAQTVISTVSGLIIFRGL